jgi:hypothetical protein
MLDNHHQLSYSKPFELDSKFCFLYNHHTWWKRLNNKLFEFDSICLGNYILYKSYLHQRNILSALPSRFSFLHSLGIRDHLHHNIPCELNSTLLVHCSCGNRHHQHHSRLPGHYSTACH